MKEPNKDNNLVKILRTGIMVLVYLAMFALLFFTSKFDHLFAFAPHLRYGLGAVFLFYGLFRAYRLWKTL